MLRDPSAAVPVLDRSTIDAVVFDIGGVFVIRHHEVVRAGMTLAGYRLPAGPLPYHRAHHDSVRAMSDLLAGVTVPDQDGDDDRLWTSAERGYLRSLGVPEDRMDRAVDALLAVVTGPGVIDVWRQVLVGNVEAFHRIVASGLPVAVVSNNDGTAAEQLRRWGVCQAGPGPLPGVTIVVDSEIEGVAKPDPAIFAPALAALGTDPARTLYVGDTVTFDVIGAVAAGMVAVQLDPYDLHADFGHARVPDVATLADLLLADLGRRRP